MPFENRVLMGEKAPAESKYKTTRRLFDVCAVRNSHKTNNINKVAREIQYKF